MFFDLDESVFPYQIARQIEQKNKASCRHLFGDEKERNIFYDSLTFLLNIFDNAFLSRPKHFALNLVNFSFFGSVAFTCSLKYYKVCSINK